MAKLTIANSDRHSSRGDDYDAAATSSAIAGLRQQLKQQATFDHPAVGRELRKLEEQLAAQFDSGSGRHRR
jgi:hypothetical protein